MYCGKCGTWMDDNVKFCPKCGTSKGASNESYQTDYQLGDTPTADTPTYDAPLYDTPNTYDTPAAKPKTHKGLIAGIVAVAAVVVIGAGAVLAAPVLKSTFMSPASYYRDVELNAFDNEFDIVEGMLNDVSSIKDGISGSVDIEPSDDLIEELMGYEAASYLGSVNSIGYDFDYASKNDLMGIDATMRLEDTKICEIEIISDKQTGTVYFGLPGLSDSYIEIDADDLDMPDIDSVLSSLDEFPKGSDVSKSAKKIVKAALNCIGKDNVKREKDRITVGDVTQSCTVYTITLDEETLDEMAIAALSAAKDDSNLKSIAYDYIKAMDGLTGKSSGYSEDDIEEMIDSSLETLIDEVDFSGYELTYYVYIDSKGNILGREFADDNSSLKMMTAQNGKNYAFEYSVISGGETIMLSGEGTKNGDKFTGDAAISVGGMDILEMEMTDYVFNSKNMTSSGKIEISFSSASSYIFSMMGLDSATRSALSAMVLTLDFDMKADSGKIDIEAGSFGKISVSAKNSTKYSPKLPSKIYAGDAEDYFGNIDMDEFVSRLEDAGISSMLTDQLKLYY